MSAPPKLFDRDALLRNRARAAKQGPALFLHEEAAFEIRERLIDVKREFKNVAIVTSQPEFWSQQFPQAKIVADTDTLDLSLDAHDLVLHVMCLHWAEDPVGQLVQCRRALKPDGLLLVSMLGGQTLSELRVALGEAEVALKGGLSPRVAPMAEIRDSGGLLQRAGLGLPVADSTKQTASYQSLFHLMGDLRAMSETNAMDARQKNFTGKNLFAEASRIYTKTFAEDDNRIPATFEMLFLTGWAPDDSQQKPLQPGSAKTRLADFLNTTEFGADAKPVINPDAPTKDR